MNKQRVRTTVLSAVAAGALIFGAGTAGATELKDVLNEGASANKLAQESQQRIDKLVDETDSLLGKYKSVLKTVEGLQIYNAQLQRQIDFQVKTIAELQESIKSVTYVKRQITPTMTKMISALEVFVQNDIPFLKEEREERVEKLKASMDDPNIEASERFRQVFEAYQIESSYGRALTSYPGSVQIDGQDRKVDFLQVGRVALLYQTNDRKTSGMWDKDANAWVEVDEANNSAISQALDVANKRIAADRLLRLPISSPEQAQ